MSDPHLHGASVDPLYKDFRAEYRVWISFQGLRVVTEASIIAGFCLSE